MPTAAEILSRVQTRARTASMELQTDAFENKARANALGPGRQGPPTKLEAGWDGMLKRMRERVEKINEQEREEYKQAYPQGEE